MVPIGVGETKPKNADEARVQQLRVIFVPGREMVRVLPIIGLAGKVSAFYSEYVESHSLSAIVHRNLQPVTISV